METLILSTYLLSNNIFFHSKITRYTVHLMLKEQDIFLDFSKKNIKKRVVMYLSLVLYYNICYRISFTFREGQALYTEKCGQKLI